MSSERERHYELNDNEVLAILHEEAAKLGPHFTGYEVRIEEAEPAYCENKQPKDVEPGYYLLMATVCSDVEETAAGNLPGHDFPHDTVFIERSSDAVEDGLKLYERGLQLVALLEKVSPKGLVTIGYPKNLFVASVCNWNHEIDDNEALALIQNTAAKLGSHFKCYSIELQEIVFEPSGYLLMAEVCSDVDSEFSGGLYQSSWIYVSRGALSKECGIHLYSKGQRLVDSLRQTVSEQEIPFYFPKDLQPNP